MTKLHIKKGDKVRVIAGESKGQEGVVKEVLKDKNRVIIEGDGIKKISKHTKPNAANPQGGIIQLEAPIHVSNVMLIDPKSGEPTRVGYKMEKDNKVRYAKKSGEVIK
ncbi:MAG: 50S ribosomal protein L24 [Vicingaceae bacterium]